MSITLLIILLSIYTMAIILVSRYYFSRKIDALVGARVEQAVRAKNPAFRIDGRNGKISQQEDEITKIKPIKYNSVTVLFADIQGFTKIVEHLNPDVLIDELDHFFFNFDSIVDKYGIQKIKTIGDAYMAAGGIQQKSSTHPVEMILVALEIQNYMKQLKSRKVLDPHDFWELRVGVHTGPVISGKIGRRNASVDIWGDTVNIASRMESTGVAGEINITGTTYQLVKEFFTCEYRGKMPVKYKGEIEMYFVKGINPELREPEMNDVHNWLFKIRLQHLRFSDLEEAMLRRLEEELPGQMFYHNVKHTIDVLTQVEIISRGEGVNEEELLLLKTAALMHDIGFLETYEGHEDRSIQMSAKILDEYKYTTAQVEEVRKLIEVTRPKAIPVNKLQAILKDADLDYLGRTDFMNLSENLFKELSSWNGRLRIKDWNRQQLDFITDHKYFTATARKMRQTNKEKHIEKLKALLALQDS